MVTGLESAWQSSLLRRLGYLRGALSGLWYACTATLVMAAGWLAQYLLADLEDRGAGSILRTAGSVLWADVLGLLPPLPVAILALNLLPKRGPGRILAWTVSTLALACWPTFYGLTDWHDPSLLPELLEGLWTAAMVVTALFYYNDARAATEQAFGSQIESAALDAERKRAQLKALHAQIEPHFLFNTLATVRTLARQDRAAGIAMLDGLMTYLHSALPEMRRDDTTLGEEQRLLDSYLGIHRVRMGSRLDYELQVPAELAGVRVPSMMLMTLVENAIKHGITPSPAGGFVRVSARTEADSVILEVADSGRGLSASQGHGTGLANIRARLRLLYGESASLRIQPAVPRGVQACIVLPRRALP